MRVQRYFVLSMFWLVWCSAALTSWSSRQEHSSHVGAYRDARHASVSHHQAAHGCARRVTVACDSGAWFRALDTLRRQVGVTERTGRNDGKAVEMYLQSVGLPSGYPWCMALQYWSFAQAGPPPILRSGLVRAVWNDALRRGRGGMRGVSRNGACRTLDWTQDGDLIVWGNLGGMSGHVERQIARGRAGWVRTIAGNVRPEHGSQAAGNMPEEGVHERLRNLRHPLGRAVLLGAIGWHSPQHGRRVTNANVPVIMTEWPWLWPIVIGPQHV